MNLLKSFFKKGISSEHNVLEARLGRTIDVLCVNAIILLIATTLFRYFKNNESSSLFALLSLPLFFAVLYFNRKQKSYLALAILFSTSAIILGIYSIFKGEESYLHSLFILNIMGLGLIYRNTNTKIYFNISLAVTLGSLLFVLLTFQFDWLEEFRDPFVNAVKDRKLNSISLIICSLVFSFVTVNSYQNQHKATKLSLIEQQTLLAELNHRVKNNMAVIISLLNMQKSTISNPETKAALEDVHDRIMSMALVHQKLYESKNKSSIELSSYISDLIKEISNSMSIEKNIKYKTEINSIHLDVSIVIPLGLILNELITNSIKHAFKDETSPEIEISLSEKENNMIELIFRDNGIGAVDEQLQKKNGLGVNLIKTLSEQIDATCLFENKNGLMFTLIFPVKNNL